MPTITIEGFKFRFYSSDFSEPPHVHILYNGKEAKIWLNDFKVEYNYGYNNRELNQIVKLTQKYQTQLLEAWNEHFSR